MTGSVALLQQFGVQQQAANNPRFSFNFQKHEVMKAVLMNSADKLEGVHGSNRTVLDSNDQDWTMSEANSMFTPLDNEMGAGHVNVRRAVQQFEPGEYDPGMVPTIGWDYGSIGGTGSTVEYILDESVGGGGYIAITLAWDRRIESTGGNTYNAGDQFMSHGVANLNLHLMTKDGTDLTLDSVWTSQSFEQNVEHIFFDNFDAGEYKIVVHHGCCDIGTPLGSTNYALAWWYGSDAPPIPGDYDRDGDVDGDDYFEFKSNFGMNVAPGSGADGNGNGIVDAADYTVWRDNLGQMAGAGSLAAVPEPNSILLLMIGLVMVSNRQGFGRVSNQREI